MVTGMADIFQLFLQGGRIEVGFLGGAQIDKYGNINTTVVGDYAQPKVRLPGSGGAAEIAMHAQRVIVVAPLSPRSFPAEVDFITSPGQNGKYGSRKQLGLPGGGPQRIVTDMGILAPASATGELELVGIYPGVAVEQVRQKVGWDLKVAAALETIEPPTERELFLLRNVLDVDHLYIGKRDA